LYKNFAHIHKLLIAHIILHVCTHYVVKCKAVFWQLIQRKTVTLWLHHWEDANTVCPEKRDQDIVCNIFYETRAILMKFGTWFPE